MTTERDDLVKRLQGTAVFLRSEGETESADDLDALLAGGQEALTKDEAAECLKAVQNSINPISGFYIPQAWNVICSKLEAIANGASRTPPSERPAGEQEAVADKPYAIEAGFSNFDGTWSVLIKRLPLNLADHEARIADVQWPSKLLYTTPPSERRLALVVTDEMALAFHRALTDGDIGADDLDEIKTGLRAALAAQQPGRKL